MIVNSILRTLEHYLDSQLLFERNYFFTNFVNQKI